MSSGMGKEVEDMEPYYPLKEGEEAHWEVSGHMTSHMSIYYTSQYLHLHDQVVERILFLYAKTNKGIGYVQVISVTVCAGYTESVYVSVIVINFQDAYFLNFVLNYHTGNE